MLVPSNNPCSCASRSEESHRLTVMLRPLPMITAAAPGGPRYNPRISTAARRAISNGIWCCSNCSVTVDRDEAAYDELTLRTLKREAEAHAREMLGRPDIQNAAVLIPEIHPQKPQWNTIGRDRAALFLRNFGSGVTVAKIEATHSHSSSPIEINHGVWKDELLSSHRRVLTLASGNSILNGDVVAVFSASFAPNDPDPVEFRVTVRAMHCLAAHWKASMSHDRMRGGLALRMTRTISEAEGPVSRIWPKGTANAFARRLAILVKRAADAHQS